MHTTPFFVIWANTKCYIVFAYVSFGKECVLILNNGFKKSQLHPYIPLETTWSRINVFWSVSSPFPILCVDLWIPGHHADNKDNTTLYERNVRYESVRYRYFCTR